MINYSHLIRSRFFKVYRSFDRAFMCLALCLVFLAVPLKDIAACDPSPCCSGQCEGSDCDEAEQILKDDHKQGRKDLKDIISKPFPIFREWFLTDYHDSPFLPAVQHFAEQMSAVAMQQVMIFGTFLDAKHQLETERLFQELQFEAHKDYMPSEDFCYFGTNVRSLAHAEEKARHNTLAMASIQQARQLGSGAAAAASSVDHDRASRWGLFRDRYCDPHDNNWFPGTPLSGLVLACGAAVSHEKNINIDIDYTRLIDEPRTLEVSFHVPGTSSPQEQDVLALGSNLYGHQILSRDLRRSSLKNEQTQHLYLALRSVAAKRSVAENSYNAIVGLKTSSSDGAPTGVRTREFLGAILAELGTPAGEVYEILGDDPSYYAQLEVLAKKIYQNPDFYANLYDTPANIKRKSVALKAIELMLDRAIHESQLRQEMATSVLLSSSLRPKFRDVNKNMGGE